MKNVKPCSSQTCRYCPTWLAHLTPTAAVISTTSHTTSMGETHPEKLQS